MKKLLISLLVLSLLITAGVFALTAAAAGEEADTVYVSNAGSDSGDGSQSAPFLTLEKALDEVPDGGTVKIVGTVTLDTSFTWAAHKKSITMTGGKLDLTAFSVASSKNADGNTVWGSTGFKIGDDVTFTNMEFTFATINWNGDNDKNATVKSNDQYERTFVFAQGHHVVFAQDVTFTNAAKTNVYLCGGGRSTTVSGGTNLEVYAGTYTGIFGGGYGGTVNGDTHLIVGGVTNANCNPSIHVNNYMIHGGPMSGTVNGDTYLTVQDNVKATQVRGGANTGTINGTMYTTIAGGSFMHVGGGNSAANTGKAIVFTMTGGTTEQVFVASFRDFGTAESPVTVTGRLLGGTVSRRIYGGCYNNYTAGIFSGSYDSSYHVYGKITLVIGEGLDAKLNTDSDQNFIAYSRYESRFPADEHTEMIFLGNAYNNLKGVLGPGHNDDGSLLGGSITKNVKYAADEIHVCDYAVDGGKITETCSYSGTLAANFSSCNHTATATLSLDPTVSLVYTGEAIEPGRFAIGSGWKGENAFELVYTDNVNAGTAAVTLSSYYAETSLNFTIQKAPNANGAPALDKVDETLLGLGDGKITGLTTDMEISTDGKTYTAVTDPDAARAAGRYYVRYAGDQNHEASEVTVLRINEGEPMRLTFVADGKVIANLRVAYGASLTELPEIPAKEGYTGRWNADLTNITESMIVYAVYTKDGGAYLFGDANGDDTVDAKDVLFIKQLMADHDYGDGNLHLQPVNGADANDDGKVDLADVILIMQYLANFDYETGTPGFQLGPQN